jgi:hypothetical protein
VAARRHRGRGDGAAREQAAAAARDDPRVASSFTRGASVGMMIVVGIESSRPASATACAWLPDEYASTPRRRAASSRRLMAL